MAWAAENDQLPLIEEDGHVDSIQENRIVINDSSYTLTPSTLFLNTQGGKSERAAFKESTMVHYAANSSREIIAIRPITHIQPPSTSTGPPSPAEAAAPAQEPPPVKKTDKLIFENGVWHN
jgi:hypothetical protein